MRSKIARFISIAALVIVISGGIYYANLRGLFTPKPSCYEQSQAYLNEFTPLFSNWSQSAQNIQQLTKDQLERDEFAMEGIRAQIGALTPPKCAEKAHQYFVAYMDDTLNGYNAFISGATEATVKTYLDNAAQSFTQYHTEVLNIYPELSASSTPTP